MESVTAISVEEAQAILDSPDLITIGARADEDRRRRHGTRTTFGRVFEIHIDAIPAALPASISAGEVRLTGRPPSIDAAVAAASQARTLAGAVPLTGFSVADLWELAGGSAPTLRDAAARLSAAGLQAIAEAAIDTPFDVADAIAAVRSGGLGVLRLTVGQLAADRRVQSVERARDIQSALGGVRVFAPLPRISSVAQPSTGYDDVKQIALARLLASNIDSIQVDWALYGPKLAQVALTMGADDVDGVSPLEGDLGRRRSPIEEIRGNIRAAGLDPVERNGTFGLRE